SPGKLVAAGRLSRDVIDVTLLSQTDAAKNRRIDADVSLLQEQIAALETSAGPAARLANLRAELKKLPADMGKAAGTAKKEMEKRLDQLRAEEKALLENKAQHGWRDDPPELVAVARLRGEGTALEKTKASPPVAIG